ncbi:hypothetical protein [Sphingomonas sp. LR55]|uniref:hypothetical protein n=1 Tax=Sphingomonas sp. LR55 TaxID=3050231 RepID=UPI002FE071CB
MSHRTVSDASALAGPNNAIEPRASRRYTHVPGEYGQSRQSAAIGVGRGAGAGAGATVRGGGGASARGGGTQPAIDASVARPASRARTRGRASDRKPTR